MKNHIGTRVLNYEIVSFLGEGGLAEVYLAKHIRLANQQVAIKILKSEYANKQVIRERFVREAEIMATLSHPNIAKVSDFVEDESMLAIILEYLEGESLDEYIRSKGALHTLSEVKRIFSQIFLGFEYAHGYENSVIHRDIKPPNLVQASRLAPDWGQ